MGVGTLVVLGLIACGLALYADYRARMLTNLLVDVCSGRAKIVRDGIKVSIEYEDNEDG